MNRLALRKRRSVDRLTGAFDDWNSDPNGGAWEPGFAPLFEKALRRNPHEPRVAVPHHQLEAYEDWLASIGWHRSGLGPNQWGNGFNVFARKTHEVQS